VVGLEGEKLPISEKIRVIRHMNIFKSDKWWAACVLIESFGRRQVALYLWHNRGGSWKRRQKFVFRSRQEWESVKAMVDELVREL